MLKIRLKRYGRKKKACYRIVAADSRVKRDGRTIEELGFYNPLTKEIHLKFAEIISHLKKGAQPTDTVKNLLTKSKVFDLV